ncbi:MAG: ZIP family metal transporter [Acutalibacteraceae bacterium]
MNVILWIIIITALSGVVGTGLGGLIGVLLKKDSDKSVSLLLSFAAGVMLSVVCFDLISSAIMPENATQQINIFIVIAGVLVGYGVIFVLNALIDKATNREVEHIDASHPKTADDLDELIHSDHYNEHKKSNSASQLFVAGLVMAAAIALHNLPEGMVIGASFASGQNAQMLSKSGIVMAVIIGLHNIPEGMSVSVPLCSGGMSKLRSVLMTAASGSPTIIGAIIGYYIGMISPLALSLSLSFASGAMLYVVFGELLPESILIWKSKLPAFATLVGMMVGLVIIYV